VVSLRSFGDDEAWSLRGFRDDEAWSLRSFLDDEAGDCADSGMPLL
jgi:hypothetical protein